MFFSILIWKGSDKVQKQELEVFYGKKIFSKPERKKFIYLRNEYYKYCWCMKTLLNVIKVLLIQFTPLVSLLVSTRIIWCLIWYLSHYCVPIRRCGDILLKRLGDLPPRSHWVFHLRYTCDVSGTNKEMPLQRRHGILLLGGR